MNHLFIRVILWVAIGVLGAKIGLRRLLFLTIAAISGFVAYALIRGFHNGLVLWFLKITHSTNAIIISAILLVLIPVFILYSYGRRLAVRLSITDSISPMINSILGAGYGVTIYIICYTIISRR